LWLDFFKQIVIVSVESRNYKVAELIVEGGIIEAPKAPKGVG